MGRATAHMKLTRHRGEGRDSGGRRKLGVSMTGRGRWVDRRTEANNPDATMLTRSLPGGKPNWVRSARGSSAGYSYGSRHSGRRVHLSLCASVSPFVKRK